MECDVINTFLKKVLYPNLNWEIIDTAFHHLSPSMGAGEMLQFLCPSCGNGATHFLGTGSFNCEYCGSTSVVDAYSNDHHTTVNQAVIELSRLARLEIPAELFKELKPDKMRFTDLVMDLAKLRHLPDEMDNLGVSQEMLVSFERLSLIPKAEPFIEYVKAVNGWIPKEVAISIEKYAGEPILLFVSGGKLIFLKLNGYCSERAPFFRSFKKGTNKSAKVYLSDDPLFIEICWSQGLAAFFVNPTFFTERAKEYMRSQFKERSVIALWSKNKSKEINLEVGELVLSYDWFSRKVPGCYQRIMEVLI